MSARRGGLLERVTRLDFLDGLGIAVGQRSVAIAHLVKRLSTITLHAHHVAPLPPVEKAAERRAALASAVRSFIGDNGVATDRVFVSLPRGAALVARLSLPLATKGDLAQVIDFELDRLIPLARDEVYHDALVRETSQKLEVLVLSVPRRVASEVSDALDDAGIRARSLVVTPIALLDFLYFCPKEDTESVVAVVEDGGFVELDHYVGGVLVASHIVKQSEVASAPAVAGLVARETSVVGGESRVYAFSRDVEPGQPGVLPPEMLGASGELLRRLEGALAVPEGFYDSASPALIPAIGAALAAVREGKGGANLLPAEERRAVEEGAPVATFLLATLLVVVTLVWLVSAVVQDHRTRSSLDAELARLEPDIRKVHESSRKADELREKLRALSQDEGLRNSLFLRELTETVPKEAYLTTFRVRNGRVELEGFAGSASDLVPLLEKSPHFKEAQFTSPVTKVQADQERFSLTAEISP